MAENVSKGSGPNGGVVAGISRDAGRPGRRAPSLDSFELQGQIQRPSLAVNLGVTRRAIPSALSGVAVREYARSRLQTADPIFLGPLVPGPSATFPWLILVCPPFSYTYTTKYEVLAEAGGE